MGVGASKARTPRVGRAVDHTVSSPRWVAAKKKVYKMTFQQRAALFLTDAASDGQFELLFPGLQAARKKEIQNRVTRGRLFAAAQFATRVLRAVARARGAIKGRREAEAARRAAEDAEDKQLNPTVAYIDVDLTARIQEFIQELARETSPLQLETLTNELRSLLATIMSSSIDVSELVSIMAELLSDAEEATVEASKTLVQLALENPGMLKSSKDDLLQAAVGKGIYSQVEADALRVYVPELSPPEKGGGEGGGVEEAEEEESRPSFSEDPFSVAGATLEGEAPPRPSDSAHGDPRVRRMVRSLVAAAVHANGGRPVEHTPVKGLRREAAQLIEEAAALGGLPAGDFMIMTNLHGVGAAGAFMQAVSNGYPASLDKFEALLARSLALPEKAGGARRESRRESQLSAASSGDGRPAASSGDGRPARDAMYRRVRKATGESSHSADGREGAEPAKAGRDSVGVWRAGASRTTSRDEWSEGGTPRAGEPGRLPRRPQGGGARGRGLK